MDTQRRDISGKKPQPGASKRPDAFWSLIVPSARLEKGRLDPTTRAYPAHSQTNHAEELEGTQPMGCKEKGNPHVITSANTEDLYSNPGVTPKDTKPVERRAGRRPEPSTREKPANFYASVTEDSGRTPSQPVIRGEKGRPEPTARAQPARPYTSLAAQLKHTQPVESDKHDDDHGLPKGEASAPTSALHKGDEDEESYEEPDDTAGSDGDDEYVENDDADDSETTSDAPSPGTKRSRPWYDTPQRASARVRGSRGERSKEASKATVSKRKTVASQPANIKGRRPRKRLKVAVEESDEEDEEYAANESVLQKATRLTKTRAQQQSASILPPLSRKHQPWTKEESETLFRLRSQGESWEYIGERVLGRTAKGVQTHWDYMRTESLQPVKAQSKRRCQRQRSSVISMMARTPHRNKPWSKEEEETLTSLRAQGKKLTYISRRIRGRGYSACKGHWNYIKDRCTQAATAHKDPESYREGDRSDRQNAQFSSASQLGQVAKEAKSNSRFTIVESEDPQSTSNGDPPTDSDDSAPAAKQTYQEAVALHVNIHSATASKTPKSKATSTDHRNQQASEHLTVGNDLTLSTDGLAHQDQLNLRSVVARRDPKTKKELSYLENFAACISARGTQNLKIHRRSYSWPQVRRV